MKPLNFLSALVLSSLFATQALASYKLVILTNQRGAMKADEIRVFISTVPPFKYLKSSEFSIDVQTIDADREGISCGSLAVKMSDAERQSLKSWSSANRICLSDKEIQTYEKGYTIQRNVQCDRPKLARIGARFGGDHTLFVLDHEGTGGSGGDVPIVYTGSPVTVAAHELLHSFGMADEYAYRREEAPAYCRQPTWTNVGIFEDRPFYASNDDVIQAHGNQIQWLPTLGPQPDLETGGKLGTAHFGQAGLYPSQTCNTISMKSWKATAFPSIMENTLTKWIPRSMWPPILNGLQISASRQKEVMTKPELPPSERYVKVPKAKRPKDVIMAQAVRPKC